jgi:hypothetical protein
MVYKLFPNSPDVEAESLDTWVLVIRPPSPNEKPDSHSTTAYRDLLSGIVEAFRYQLTNTTNKLYTKQGPESSRAFLSSVLALYSSTTEDFALGLYTGIHHTSAFFHPDTPPTSDVGSPLADSTEEEKTRKPAKAIQSREDKLEKFIANAREALLQLVNNHWEQLAGGLQVQTLQGDLFSRDKRMRRVYHHHELRRLRLETELHWLRWALSLIRNLRDF